MGLPWGTATFLPSRVMKMSLDGSENAGVKNFPKQKYAASFISINTGETSNKMSRGERHDLEQFVAVVQIKIQLKLKALSIYWQLTWEQDKGLILLYE